MRIGNEYFGKVVSSAIVEICRHVEISLSSTNKLLLLKNKLRKYQFQFAALFYSNYLLRKQNLGDSGSQEIAAVWKRNLLEAVGNFHC